MTRKNFGIGLAVLLVTSGALTGQEKKDKQESNALSPEDFLQLRGIQDPQFSPDGTRVAFVVTDPLAGQKRTRHIWIHDLKSKATRQFTYSEKSETSPRWSPDGKQLAFLSGRGGDEQQIFVMRVDGGEAAALTKSKESIGAFEWAPDGQEIAFSGDHSVSSWHVYVINRDGSDLRLLVKAYSLDPAWSADGSRLGFYACVSDCGLYQIRSDGTGRRPLGVVRGYSDIQPDFR